MENVEPIQLSVSVPLSQDRAFTLFTERLDTWWPFEGHSLSGGDGIASCTFGEDRIVERSKSGEEHVWAEVLVYERPHRFVLAWHPGGGPATELEVTFTPSDSGTLVELEHRKWEVFGEQAAEARGAYSGGWRKVFEERFAQAAREASHA